MTSFFKNYYIFFVLISGVLGLFTSYSLFFQVISSLVFLYFLIKNKFYQYDLLGLYGAYIFFIIRNKFGPVSWKIPSFYGIKLLEKKILHFHYLSLPKEKADLMMNMIFGNQLVKLPLETYDLYKKVGLTHLLVASGTQVSLLNGMIMMILPSLFSKKWLQFLWLTLANIALYLITGGGDSIVRAILMNELVLGLALFYEKTSPIHILLFVLLVMMVWNPSVIFSIGAQLSFAATASLLIGTQKINDFLSPFIKNNFIKNNLSTCLSPLLWTFPILVFHFHEISWVAFFSNILAIPLVECLVISGAFSSFLGLLYFPLGFYLNKGNEVLLILLDRIVTLLGQTHVFILSPKNRVQLMGLALIFLLYTLVQKFEKKNPIFHSKMKPLTSEKENPEMNKNLEPHLMGLKCLKIKNMSLLHFFNHKKKVAVFMGILFFIVLEHLYQHPGLRVTVLDVGQGDSAIIETKNHVVLLDTGPQTRYQNAGRNVVYPWLKKLGIKKIDFLILTHPDIDHTGGFDYLKKNIPIKTVIENSRGFIYEKMVIDDVVFELVYPPFLEDNNKSILLKITHQNHAMLFMGDAEKKVEEWLMIENPEFCRSELIKIGHHGSKSSSDPVFIQAVHPKIALISVGKHNAFHHPNEEVLNTLAQENIEIYRTDIMGTVQISMGETVDIKTFKPFFKKRDS